MVMVDNELTSTSPPQKENKDENPSNAYINPIVPKKYKLMTSGVSIEARHGGLF